MFNGHELSFYRSRNMCPKNKGENWPHEKPAKCTLRSNDGPFTPIGLAATNKLMEQWTCAFV